MSTIGAFFTSCLVALFVYPAHVQAGAVPPTNLTRAFDLMKRDLLVNSASLAREIAKEPEDEVFSIFLYSVVQSGLIQVAHVGKIGRVDPAAASRWVNGHSYPSILVREIVLIRMADEFEAEASSLSRKWKNPMPSVDCADLLRNK